MKYLLALRLSLVLTWSFAAFAQVNPINEEFSNFYNSPQVRDGKCGVNIKNFLKHLQERGVSASSGYVVSVHEPFMHLNHFNARWGREERYENGEIYNHSNWYFHVFVVLDGIAYDFSQKDTNGIPLQEYLVKSYLPRHTTENIIMQGKLTREELLKNYLGLEMNIYNLQEYADSMGPTFYEGRFFELFALSSITTPSRPPQTNTLKIPEYKKGAYGHFPVGEARNYIKVQQEYNLDGINIYENPYAQLHGTNYPLKADAHNICQALGNLGTFPYYSQEKELEIKQAPLLDLSTSVMPRQSGHVDPLEDIRASFRYLANDQYWNYKIMTRVGCGDLRLALRFL